MLVEFGRTRVLCAASFTAGRAALAQGQGHRLGDLRVRDAAALDQHPQPTASRARARSAAAPTRSARLIGRSLRAIIDTKALGENTIVLDCDVLQADGGTRTASITGAYVALVDAIEDARAKGLIPPGRPAPDGLDRGGLRGHHRRRGRCSTSTTPRTSTPSTDMNVVMTGDGRFVEVQGTAEGQPFDRDLLNRAARQRHRGLRRPHPRCSRRRWPRPPASACSDAGRPRDPQRPQGRRAARTSSPTCARSSGSRSSGASEFADAPDVVEDEVTFEGNARLKAVALAAAHRSAGAGRRLRPGRRRARWRAGHLLARWAGATATTGPTSSCCSTSSPTSRTSTARRPSSAPPCSRCPTARCAPPRAVCRGPWPESPRAANGFGYDPVLVVEGDTRHCAELSAEEKNAISHRGKAFRAMVPHLRELLGG